MGKYRGVDGWVHCDSEERPRRYKASEPVSHVPKGDAPVGKSKSRKEADPIDVGCGLFAVFFGLGTGALILCVVLGVFRKALTWLWG